MRQINLQNNIINRTVTALMMTDVAGWIDTIGILRFLRNVGVFPAYMSGNTTRVFTSAAEKDFAQMQLYIATIVLLLVGVTLGQLINNGRRRREAAALFFLRRYCC